MNLKIDNMSEEQLMDEYAKLPFEYFADERWEFYIKVHPNMS